MLLTDEFSCRFFSHPGITSSRRLLFIVFLDLAATVFEGFFTLAAKQP